LNGLTNGSGQNPFEEFMRSMDHFFQEKPVKGFLQSIDELFASAFPFESFPVEIDETDEHFVVAAKIPNVKKDQIEIDIFQQYITITVMYKATEKEENTENHSVFQKNGFKRLSRTISLPQPFDEQKVRAHYDKGVLKITVQKDKKRKLQIE